MEMKAVIEYEESKYLTKDEVRNKLMRFLMNFGKRSIKIFVIFYIVFNMIISHGFSQIIGGLTTDIDEETAIKLPISPTIDGGLETTAPIFDNIKIVLSLLALITGGVSFVLLMFGLKNTFKIKKIEDEEEKIKLKSKRETQFIYAGFILLISIFLYVSCNIIYL